MRRITRSALAAMLLAVAAPIPAMAAETCGAPREDGRAELCKTTVVTGKWTARMPVHLPKAATIDVGFINEAFTDGHNGVAVEGEGSLIGVQLLPEDLGVGGFFAYRMADLGTSLSPYVTLGSYDPATERFSLQAGNYFLYLVTDGLPVTATIRFDGLTGQTQVTPDTRVRGKVVSPRHIIDTGAVYRAADRDRIGESGGVILLIQQAAARPVPGTVGYQGGGEDSMCIYPAKPAGQEPPDQHLDCQRTTGSQGWGFAFPPTGADRRIFKMNWVEGGLYGVSASMIGTSGLVGRRTTLALFLDFA